MKTIFLHIGKHKTGSTSIQHYLYKNSSYLLEKNYYVISEEQFSKQIAVANPTNSAQIAHLIIRKSLKTPVRLRGNFLNTSYLDTFRSINHINRKLKSIENSNIIISAEAFSFIRTRYEMILLRFMLRGFKVIPVVYLRDKETWMKSWYTQLIPLRKKLKLIDPPQEGIFDFTSNSWLVDDKNILRTFGKKTIALSYENCLKEDNSVIPSFLKTLGLSLDDCPSWKDIWHNNSEGKITQL